MDKLEIALACVFVFLVCSFCALIWSDILNDTETQIITLDSGKQCVATVKGNDVTNLRS